MNSKPTPLNIPELRLNIFTNHKQQVNQYFITSHSLLHELRSESLLGTALLIVNHENKSLK